MVTWELPYPRSTKGAKANEAVVESADTWNLGVDEDDTERSQRGCLRPWLGTGGWNWDREAQLKTTPEERTLQGEKGRAPKNLPSEACADLMLL